MLGNPSKMDKISEIAKKHGLSIVEDCCQATGASFMGEKVGSFGNLGAFSLNIYKTMTSGDGGLVITDDDDLAQRIFALHDQGHSLRRTEPKEVGSRNIVGFNFRMNELTGAVALAQLRKLDNMLNKLRENKEKVKDGLSGLNDFSYRILNDPAGECATVLTLIFKSRQKAKDTAARLNTNTLNNSGWHIYYNMEHILKYLKDNGTNIGKGSFPRSDDILERSLNITIGLICPAIQAVFGININSSEKEIEEKISILRKAILDS
jgi:8-amino-3,8-dideoxy-alpha-D-manno-octulosonate transaminase